MSNKYPIINEETNIVDNVISLAEGSTWQPPTGYFIGILGGDIGDTWNGTSYTKPIPPLPPLENYTQAIQNHIDATAQSKQYTNGFALASYVTSTVPQWKAEAETFVAWRDSVWVYVYQELEKVESGIRPQPTIQELLSELPTIQW